MITQSNSSISNTDENIIQSYNDLSESSNQLGENIAKTLEKFHDLDVFFQKADDVVDYYFSLQSKYKEKEDFIKYLKGLLKIYVSYFSEAFDEDDEEVENIIEYIEDNYDFLLYHGENINPIYKRINDPSSGSVRKQLTKSIQKRLLNLLLE